MTVERNRVAAQYYEFRPGVIKLDQEIAKIVKQLDHERGRGTKQTGILSREYTHGSCLAMLKLSMVSWVVNESASAPRTHLT